MAYNQPYDVVIIGGGIAGLSVALRLPEEMHVALFTKGQLGESNTRYAQGGLAVAVGADDSPELHFQDTLAAGAGLCDKEAVRILVEQGPAAVNWLMQMGVQFDRAEPGSDFHATSDGLLLGREAAHSRWRVLHAGGDATGAEIERALMNALRKRTSLHLYEETFVSDLLIEDGVCTGVSAMSRDGRSFTIHASATVLASGGAGGLWLHTSNPSGATADGLALAWQAGAALTDLEFMQFHPTVLVAEGSSHLISEAVRGEGAYLRNHAGERFMPRYHASAELAPRDVVARAILTEMLSEQTDCQYLDLRHLPAERIYARFPTITAICHKHGLDLARDLIPVAPAAHYCMGGVLVDTTGRTTLPGLYAVGEVACTGVHGANRLASNSLLEGLVFGLRAADGIADAGRLINIRRGEGGVERLGGPLWSPAGGDLLPLASHVTPAAGDHKGPPHSSQPPSPLRNPGAGFVKLIHIGQPQGSLLHVHPHAGTRSISDMSLSTLNHIRQQIRHIMWQYVSLCRDQEGLSLAQRELENLRNSILTIATAVREQEEVIPAWIETINMLTVAELVVLAALQRRESRGSHWRRDFEASDDALAGYHYAFQRVNANREEAVERSFQQELIPHV